MPCLSMGREGRIFRLQRPKIEFPPLLDSCPRDGTSALLSLDFHVLGISSAEVLLILLWGSLFPETEPLLSQRAGGAHSGSHSLMGSFVGTTGLPNSGSMDLWSSVPLSSVESAVDA